MKPFKATPMRVHVITGFLGAGKTTLISALLAARPEGERWAVLVNEFGEIGIDQVAWAGSGVLVREVPGGCICCAQNLPLQIALGEIVEHAGADRLLIEPTGLGHPVQLLETLREPHWQPHLQVQATLCVIDARRLDDPRLTDHETFSAQVACADVLVFSRADQLAEAQRAAALAWAADRAGSGPRVVFASPEAVDPAWLDTPPRPAGERRRSLLHPRPGVSPAVVADIPQTPPYHYEKAGQGHVVGGWVFPADWRFAHDPLLATLMAWQGLERLKGVFHTERGWIFFNATVSDLAIKSSEYRADSRVELIAAVAPDWSACEAALLATLDAGEQQQRQT